MKIEPRDLQYFASVARLGHVGRAAEALGLSQPALSKSLRRLETAIGAKLVKRTPKGVDLTAVGSALSQRARSLQQSLDDIVREAVDLGRGSAGRVRVGASQDMAGSLLPAACAATLKQLPKVSVKVMAATPDVLAPALIAGDLDIAVMPTRPNGHDRLVNEPILEESFVVLSRAGHRLAGKSRVTLAEVAGERWALGRGPAQEALFRVFEHAGLPPPDIAVEAISSPFRFHLLHLTDLLSFGPRRYARIPGARHRLLELPVKELALRRVIAVHYRKDAYLPPATVRFIEILKAQTESTTR
jgi:DNA-binding transcriptional LysR family regulator